MNELSKLQKIESICAILEVFIYITAFIFYGGIIVFPSVNASANEKLNFLTNNYNTLSILNFISYILFGILLAILVVAIHQRLKTYHPALSKLTFSFGILWVGLVIACGMISNIGLHHVVTNNANTPENTMLIWSSVSIITKDLGGGNEIVGGIWVLLISVFALKNDIFTKSLNILGCIVGLSGILSVYPLDIFTEIFGVSQIVWFIWIGVYMIRKS
ncbi:DUF4386 family protein [Tenacibaculum sp. M341]|nr:DUF4386 family protein [Tenacibaculum sp. M341]